MKIETKYNIGDTVWYIKDFDVHDFHIIWIRCNKEDSEDLYDWDYLWEWFIKDAELSVDSVVFATEQEAKQALIKQLEEQINNLK